MEKKKFDFEKYAQWCKENHLDASQGSSLEQYNLEQQKAAETSEKETKMAEQKKIFDAINKYLGRNVQYDPRAFEFLNEIWDNILFSIKMAGAMTDGTENIGKAVDNIDNVLKEFGKEEA